MSTPIRLLVKLRPGAAFGMAAARANLRPLFEAEARVAPAGGLGMAGESAWHLAELPADAPSPWDAAHVRIADRLGLDGDDLLFVEPDLAYRYPTERERAEVPSGAAGDAGLAAVDDCSQDPQTTKGGRVPGPGFAWHLDDDHSQLAAARAAVSFSAPRTRIAHIDTGFDPQHAAAPRFVALGQRNFVDADGNPNSATDPNHDVLFDQAGHGTGTIGLLAGGAVARYGNLELGGCPEAEILPLRIADRVILLWTSVLARALRYAIDQRCDVVSLSMGGLPSRAWNETVDAAYEAGVCLVAASGDCFVGGLPMHHVVYPARYRRALAACGVMANGEPYYGLSSGIQGSWGPESAMTAALSAYTPNVPWAKLGCGDVLALDGGGTSAATPQIAAAAAIWLEKFKATLPRDWRRVEAVRHALFASAAPPASDRKKYLGRGVLRARLALDVAPVLSLPKSPRDSDSFAFFRVITGLGIDEGEAPPREAMFGLELAQRWLANPELAEAIPEPEVALDTIPRAEVRRFLDAAIGDPGASLALRRLLADRYPLLTGGLQAPVPRPPKPGDAGRAIETETPPAFEAPSFGPDESKRVRLEAPRPPATRRVRVYAIDPSFSTRLETASTNEAVLRVRWEALEPGPVGEYLEVVDVDDSGVVWPAVELDDPRLLAQDGLAPAEGDPRFHQQMVYAVAMATIEHFERALGRPVIWRPRPNPDDAYDDSRYVRRLLVRPHAFRGANAFYSPREVALRFGHFQAGADAPGEIVPGSAVYTCLSHDVVAHETTHAILDGMHRRFGDLPTNRDVLAFHEGLADVVALAQHFTLPELLAREIAKTRGDLEAESMLGELAVQFGRASGHRGALRSAIGRYDAAGRWVRGVPDPGDYERAVGPHARGALLVSAVFDAFLAIYRTRTADLFRLATGGTGVLPAGALHPDLVARLTKEATKSARHVLNLCIRALDYLPPVDVTFGEYLRAMITADYDLVPDDPLGYRVAFVESFRARGIYPLGLRTLSVDTLRWRGVKLEGMKRYRAILKGLKSYADACFYVRDRERLFQMTRVWRGRLHDKLQAEFVADPELSKKLGLDPALAFEVHSLRRAARTTESGHAAPQVVVALTQSREVRIEGVGPRRFHGGATLVVDLAAPSIQYAICKDVHSQSRLERTTDYFRAVAADPLASQQLGSGAGEPFALLHLRGFDR
jgi:hypothetical protein